MDFHEEVTRAKLSPHYEYEGNGTLPRRAPHAESRESFQQQALSLYGGADSSTVKNPKGGLPLHGLLPDLKITNVG
jgi:hypothetical protein